MGTGNPGVFQARPQPLPVNTLTLSWGWGIPRVWIRVWWGFKGIRVVSRVTVYWKKIWLIYKFNHSLHNPIQHPNHHHQIHREDLQRHWYRCLPQALTYSKPRGTSMHVLRPLSVNYGCEIKWAGLCWRLVQRQRMSLRGKCEFRLPMWWKETYQEYRDSCAPYVTSADKLPAFRPTKEEGLWCVQVQC